MKSTEEQEKVFRNVIDNYLRPYFEEEVKRLESAILNLSDRLEKVERVAAEAERAMAPRLLVERPDPCRFGHHWQTSHTIGIRSGHSAKPFCRRCGLETHS